MIVFSAIAPHSPLLVPSIGKEHREKLQGTVDAYRELEERLYIARPDTLVILAPHGPTYADAFSGNVAQEFTCVLKEFGDHGTALKMPLDHLVLDHLKRACRKASIPFTLTSQEELEYGYTVPLLFLTPHLSGRLSLLPLSPSLLDAKTHFRFGQELQHVFQDENRRIAVLASADLSHVPAKGEATEKQEQKTFDRLVRSMINGQNSDGLLALDPKLVAASHSCGYRPIVTLAGLLSGLRAKPRELCYEAPFSVGYLTTAFDLS